MRYEATLETLSSGTPSLCFSSPVLRDESECLTARRDLVARVLRTLTRVRATELSDVWAGDPLSALEEHIQVLASSEASSPVSVWAAWHALQLHRVGANVADRFSEIAKLSDNWNNQGAAAPSAEAISLARRAVRLMRRAPDRIVADADGGVAIYLFGSKVREDGAHHRYASLVVGNDGEVALVLRDRTSNRVDARDLEEEDLSDALAAAEAFVSIA
jgi:hypothetical protein